MRFRINRDASTIPPPALKGKQERATWFPIDKDHFIALKLLTPLFHRFHYHYSKVRREMSASIVWESEMSAFIRDTHSVGYVLRVVYTVQNFQLPNKPA